MSLEKLIQESAESKESWHYTSLKSYEGLNLPQPKRTHNFMLPEALTGQRLVFIDGTFVRRLSTLEGLPKNFIEVAGEALDGQPQYKITLEGHTCLAIEPVEILFLSGDEGQSNQATTHFDISLGQSSRLTLIERHVGTGSKLQARHIVTNVTLAPQAKLVHGKVVSGHDEAMHFAQTKIKVSEGAFYDHFGLIVGGKVVRCEKEIDLDGKLAEARLLGGMLLHGKARGDMTNLVRHNVPHCSSRQICKAVLNDASRGVFQGSVYVAEGAQKTDAYQLCRALLISRQAEMNAKPELEIYADDVKCTHGTALGDLDDDVLFYLRSRGIEEATARRMLIHAFMRELVDMIQAPDLACLVKGEVDKWL